MCCCVVSCDVTMCDLVTVMWYDGYDMVDVLWSLWCGVM